MRWCVFWVSAVLSGACDETKSSNAVPDLSLPPSIDVVEGGSTSLIIRTVAPPATDVRGSIDLRGQGSQLQAEPKTFTLSPATTSQEITLTALGDDDREDGGANIFVALDGGNPIAVYVVLLDQQIQRAIPSTWTLPMIPASTATVDVHLTQPPTAPATVRVVSNDTFAVYGKPFELTFDATNYDVPQTVTLTSREELARGPVELFLFSDFPTSTITIVPVQ
jgi:hypothetical protein